MSDQPDQPPRRSFSDDAQQMRRDLAITLRAHETFARNAAEILERPNCTIRLMKEILDRTAEHFAVIASCKLPLDQWALEPLADVGLDLPLGRMIA